MRSCRLTLIWLLLLPLLPACSLIPAQQPTVEGFSPESLQQVRQQSEDLERLQGVDHPTVAQQHQIRQLNNSLQQFERDVIRSANRLERQNDWYGADKVLHGATLLLPDSQQLSAAQTQFAERRQLREERVRMELAIHQGEQLLKDGESYQRLRQLKGPDPITWLELKNYYRKSSEAAQALHQHAQRALQRGDNALAQRGLKIAQGLYGEELQQNEELRKNIERDLAVTYRRLRPARPQPATEPADKEEKLPVAELQQALDTGDLLSARQHLNQLREQSPQHEQLLPLQSRFHTQLHSRVETAIKRGNDLYSQGYIERALNIWREAKTLDPDNVELLANIARAEKVLQNLRALSAPSDIKP